MRAATTGSRRSRAVALGVTGVVLVGIAVFWICSSNDKESLASIAPVPPASQAQVRLGPGLWTAEAASAGRRQFEMAIQPPQAPNVTPDGKLAVDQTLHQVIDFFLLGGLPGDRNAHAAQLRIYLSRTLSRAAGAEALQVVDRYLLYMNLHDDLLTRQALPQWVDLPSPAEAERVTNWVVQRTRLRQTILGQDVMQAWYATEEAAIQQGLAEFDTSNGSMLMRTGEVPQSSEDSNSIRAARMAEGGREARREQFLRTLTEQASKSYAVLERERQSDAARGKSSS